MSFAKTTAQMLARTKTVTRRLAWRTLQPGTTIQAIRQGQGLKKGERVQKLGVLRIVRVTQEPLRELLRPGYGDEEAQKEGFPQWTGAEFAAFFCAEAGCTLDTVVTRIEFEHL